MPSVGSLTYAGAAPLLKLWVCCSHYPQSIHRFPRNTHTQSSQIPEDFARLCLRSKRHVSPGSKQGRFLYRDKPSPPRVDILEHRACAHNQEHIRNRPLVLLAIVYILTGLLCGVVIREVCYVPRNFWQGIVVASGLSNWSTLRMCRFALSSTAMSNSDFDFP